MNINTALATTAKVKMPLPAARERRYAEIRDQVDASLRLLEIDSNQNTGGRNLVINFTSSPTG
jgi:hypothetical protein